MIRVAIFEDHPLVQDALQRVVQAESDFQLVAVESHGSQIFDHAAQTDVALFDLGMSVQAARHIRGSPVYDPLQTISWVRARHPRLRVLVISAYQDPAFVRAVLKAGAHGYLHKSDDLLTNLAKAVRVVHAGGQVYSEIITALLLAGEETWLQPQDLTILSLMARGLNTEAISRAMNLSAKRVSNRLSEIYRGMGLEENPDVNTRMTAVIWARQHGLLPRDD